MAGADIEAKGSEGLTSLQLARRNPENAGTIIFFYNIF